MSPMGDPRYTPQGRATLAAAVAGREVSDLARGIVGDLATLIPAAERVRSIRALRHAALVLLDRVVLSLLLAGETWEAIADGYGLPVDELRRRYEPTLEEWRAELGALPMGPLFDPTGLRQDDDPAGTAATIDAWLARHAEPWDGAPEPGAGPVERALHA